MNMFDESNISDETRNIILSRFPNKYKLSVADLLINEKPVHDQIFIIYFDDYKNNNLFSFEHLCRLINEIVAIPINKIINKHRRTGEWTLAEIPVKKMEFIVEKILV